MTEQTIRPWVIDLLRRLDAETLDLGPNGWTIDAGRPLTREERKLALSATKDELEAVVALFEAAVETMSAEQEATEELMALCLPYMGDHKTTVSEAVAQMSPEQRERAEYLLREALPQWIEVPRR